MNMKADFDSSMLRKNSLLFWCTLVVPAAIIAIGINFILNPVGASAGFGIPIHDPAAFPFMWIKGIRDIFAGLVVLPFLWKGDRRTTATLFAISIFVPFGDGLVILRHLGFAPPIYIHWGTALYMMIVGGFPSSEAEHHGGILMIGRAERIPNRTATDGLRRRYGRAQQQVDSPSMSRTPRTGLPPSRSPAAIRPRHR